MHYCLQKKTARTDQDGVLLHPWENPLSYSFFPKATADSAPTWSYKFAYQRNRHGLEKIRSDYLFC